jgi:uncharacterized protein (TIGR03435 family)
MKPDLKNVDEVLHRYLPSAPKGEMESAGDRVLLRLKLKAEAVMNAPFVESPPVHSFRWRRVAMVSAAAAVLLVVFARTTNVWRHLGAFAVVEVADGTLTGTVDGKTQTIHAGEVLQKGETIRSNADGGATLVLADGSRIEMRPRSELSLESADDGAKIRLNDGGVIVNAAKQRTGHLYVQTKDVTVSVVGTVFFVNAEEAGSRVAVLQGQVLVQLGTIAKKLRPGEQVATNPLMESHSVSDEISWSGHAEAHMALLQQSAASMPAIVRPEFEVASLRPAAFDIPTLVRCRGIDGEFAPVSATAAPVPLGRCVGSSVSLKLLVAAAYDINEERISGIPDGTFPTYQLQAAAENASTVTTEQLRQMLQNFLADRFKLKVHRETKEAQGYVIFVGKDGVKFKETSGDEEPPQGRPVESLGLPTPGQRQLRPTIFKGQFRLKRLADSWSEMLGGLPVIDKTGLQGIYDISLTLTLALELVPPPANALEEQRGPRPLRVTVTVEPRRLANALEEQLGLRLESAKVPVEYLVVDHVEKPSGN